MLPKKSNAPFYLMMAAVLTVIMTFLAMHMGYCEMILTEKGETDIGIFKLLQGAIETISSNPFCVFPPKSEYFSNLPVMLIFTYLLVGYVFYDEQRNKHDSSKIVQGSAKWNTDYKKYNKKYSDPAGSKKNDGSYNMILSEHVRLNMNTKKTFLNNNVLVIGGSGSGKTRYLLKPNILQANASYVITDPSGEILASTGTFLKEQGYKIKVFNLVDMVKSDRYNPFNYIRDETGVNQLINCLIKNTNDGKSGGDPFWEKSEIALLQALIFYLINHRPKKEQNFSSVMKLLRACQIDENNPDAKSKLDLIYEQIGKEDPNDVGYKSYLTFKMGAGKTLKSILISCGVRLNHFNIPTIANLTTEDTIDLKTLGDEKQALFIIIPAADDTYNFLVSMMYTQLFETLYYHAEIECPAGFYIRKENGDMDRFIQNEDEANAYLMEHAGYKKEKGSNHLAFHTRFLLDEFANVGQIPSFEKKNCNIS